MKAWLADQGLDRPASWAALALFVVGFAGIVTWWCWRAAL